MSDTSELDIIEQELIETDFEEKEDIIQGIFNIPIFTEREKYIINNPITSITKQKKTLNTIQFELNLYHIQNYIHTKYNNKIINYQYIPIQQQLKPQQYNIVDKFKIGKEIISIAFQNNTKAIIIIIRNTFYYIKYKKNIISEFDRNILNNNQNNNNNNKKKEYNLQKEYNIKFKTEFIEYITGDITDIITQNCTYIFYCTLTSKQFTFIIKSNKNIEINKTLNTKKDNITSFKDISNNNQYIQLNNKQYPEVIIYKKQYNSYPIHNQYPIILEYDTLNQEPERTEEEQAFFDYLNSGL